MSENTVKFLSGDQALAQGAYEHGLRFAASYPGTPATEVLEYLSAFKELDTQWSVNEKVAYEVALAASIAGARSLYASKHVGLNVAMDPLMTSVYTGVGAGFVVVVADDPGIHSSQNEQDTRLLAKAAHIPLIEPSSPQEAYEFVKTAFQISEEFDTPVLIRLTTRVAHTKENIQVGVRKDIPLKGFKVDVPKYVMVPRNAYNKHLVLQQRMLRLKDHAQHTALNRIEINKKNIGFITSSVSYLYAKEMYPEASFLKLGLSYPLAEAKIKEFSRKVKRVFILEELEPFLEEQVALTGIKYKAKPASWQVGELRPEYLPLIVKGQDKKEEEYTARKPVMCPGCPHRGVFSVLKSLRLTVTGDIGCYTLGALPPLSSLHTCLCMGAGVTFFEGMSKVLGANQVVGVIGDSTFVHSGITGLINAAYNKAKGLVIILDNSTTAMTGSQPHPATGMTIKAEPTKRLVLEDICKSCGADNVDVVDPFQVNKLKELISQRINQEALSVIIARYPCRLIERKKNNVPVYIQEKCSKCYLCLGINCPALTKAADGSISVNTNICTGCGLCVQACKLGALK